MAFVCTYAILYGALTAKALNKYINQRVNGIESEKIASSSREMGLIVTLLDVAQCALRCHTSSNTHTHTHMQHFISRMCKLSAVVSALRCSVASLVIMNAPINSHLHLNFHFKITTTTSMRKPNNTKVDNIMCGLLLLVANKSGAHN